MANRDFNKKQSAEKEVKELFLAMTLNSAVAATAVTTALTSQITYTAATAGTAANGHTVTIQVAAAAANPTSTILAAFTGTAAATVITITPNDGTNNTATPVNLTTAQLVTLINTGSVPTKSITLTDASSLRANFTATGGGAQNLVDAGEGDGAAATFASGAFPAPTINSGIGFSSVTRNGVGDFTIAMDKYYALKAAKGLIKSSSAQDVRVQIKTNSISSGSIRILLITGTTPVETAGMQVLMRMDLKNTASSY